METFGAVAAVNVHVALWTQVQNSAQLRARLMDEKWECAVINAAMALDLSLVLAAAQRAIFAQNGGYMKAKTLHTELMFQLSPRNNIGEALKVFGLADSSTAALFVAVGGDADEWLRLWSTAVQGVQAPLSQLPEHADDDQWRRLYKMEDVASLTQAVPLIMSLCAVKSL